MHSTRGREILSTGCARSHGPRSGRLALEAVESFDNVAEEARFALLAVGDNIDARFDLFPNNLRNRLVHNAREFVAIVGLSFLSQSKKRCQGIGPGRLPTWVVRILSALCFIISFLLMNFFAFDGAPGRREIHHNP